MSEKTEYWGDDPLSEQQILWLREMQAMPNLGIGKRIALKAALARLAVLEKKFADDQADRGRFLEGLNEDFARIDRDS